MQYLNIGSDVLSADRAVLFQSVGLSPALNIPLSTSLLPVKGNAPYTFNRDTTKSYIDENRVLQTIAIDVPRFEGGGVLIEPEAENLFVNPTSPATQTVTVASGEAYTVFGNGSGSVVLSGAGSGTVTEGNPVTITASSTGLICTVSNMDIVNVQPGESQTSFIEIAGTRTPDELTYDISGVITQGQGSLYCEFTLNALRSTYYRIWVLSNGTSSNRLYLYVNAWGKITVIGVTNGSTAISLSSGIDVSIDTIYRALLTYKDDEVILYINGVLVESDTSGAIATNFSQLDVGQEYSGGYNMIGSIGKIKYYSNVLSSAQSIRMTA